MNIFFYKNIRQVNVTLKFTNILENLVWHLRKTYDKF